MRVAQMVSATTFAGIERHVLRLSRELGLRGVDVRLIAPAAAVKLREEAARLGLITGTYRACLTWDELDVIHVHEGRSALAGAVLAGRSRAALVRTQHFVEPASAGRPWVGRKASLIGHRLLNRRVDAYIAVSRAAREAAVQRDAPPGRTFVINPGIDRVDPAVVTAALRQRETVTDPVVVSAGRLERERRFEVLIRAAPRVLEDHPGARFIIAGDGPVRGELQRLAEALGIASAFTWTGWVDDLGSVLADGHVYVNTLPSEGFGLATAEAMAYALPVVAVRGGASPELVQDGVTGRLVPPSDAESLARAILGLMADRSGAARMGEAGREIASRNLAGDMTAAATLALYERLVNSAQDKAPV